MNGTDAAHEGRHPLYLLKCYDLDMTFALRGVRSFAISNFGGTSIGGMRAIRCVLIVGHCLVAAPFTLDAQVDVTVRDEEGRPVQYAHITWQPLDGNAGGLVVMDTEGKATIPANEQQLEVGVAVRTSFVGYSTIQDTLRSDKPTFFTLFHSATALQEVVITGQYAPIVPEKAVQRVRVLDGTYFKRIAANNLGDALRNQLNIRLAQDNILGISMSMQGMGGQNVKLLIDGVPVIGRQDGNVDLAQIDLTGIERAEIVEGPLSVNYGTNALAGTINLITRKGGGTPASFKFVSYVEHIGRLNTTLTATRHWGKHDVVLTAGRNFFGGWDPRQKGMPHFDAALADTMRYQQWKPRQQYFGRLNYRWSSDRWTFGYKGEVMHDVITDRGMPRAPYYETAFDQRFRTIRLDNAVFAEGRWARGRRFNALLAHNRYDRVRNTWFRDLTTMGEELIATEGMQDTTRFALTNLRASFSSAPDSAKLAYELGVDLNHETGSGQRLGMQQQVIGDYAGYASLEWKPLSKFTLRPGLRYAYNTRFAAPLVPSVNLRWLLNERFTVRASYARGFRAPSLKELYFLFVDVNHDIAGNAELEPERSHNMNLGINYRHAKERTVYTSEINLFNNVIDNLITLAQISGTHYSYVNIGQVHTMGGSAGAGWDNGHWTVTVGGSITGRYDALSKERNEEILYSPELRASITKQWQGSGWSASVFWKYQGKLNSYIAVNDTEVQRSFIAPFHMADASISKSLFAKRLDLSLGCKDLFNVRNVTASGSSGVHSTGATSVPMTTGRTVFLRLELQLTKK